MSCFTECRHVGCRDVLGAEVSGVEALPEHGVYTVFVKLDNTKLELLHPLGDNSPIQVGTSLPCKRLLLLLFVFFGCISYCTCDFYSVLSSEIHQV